MSFPEAMGAVGFKKTDPKRLQKIQACIDDDNQVGQRKLNGERIGISTEGIAYGRGTSKYGGRMTKTALMPHIISALKGVPAELDGEVLFIPDVSNMSLQQIKNMDFVEDFWTCRSIMGKYQYPETAVEQQEQIGKLHFFVFDVLSYWNAPLLEQPLRERIKILDKLATEVLHDNAYVHVVPYVYGKGAKQALLDHCLSLGLEGIVTKNLNGIYVPGKKPTKNWNKLKKDDQEDGIVIGFAAPSPRTEVVLHGKKVVGEDGRVVTRPNRFFENGWVGAIWVGQWTEKPTQEQLAKLRTHAADFAYIEEQRLWVKTINGSTHYLVPVAKVSGMSDQFRAEVSHNKKQYLGQVMAFDWFEKTDDAYYQPRYSHFRDDKPMEECIWE